MAIRSVRRRKAPYAVLTGDLVRSTELSPERLNAARSVLGEAGQDIARWTDDAVAAPVEFFRGDAWQLALGEARFFLRAALYVRAKLRAASMAFDSRIGIGLGKVDELDAQRTSLSTGEAFIISGRTLDSISGANGLSIGLPESMMGRLGWVGPLGGLCDAVSDHWTERQAAIVCRMLSPGLLTQHALASELDISKQVVSKQLAAADYAALVSALEYVEKVDWTWEATRPIIKFI